MQQLTLARQAEFPRYGKKTRREQFLCEMEAVMPWSGLLSLVAPYYSKGEAAQPDYALTGDKRAGLLKLNKLGRTKILTAGEFCADVLRL